MTGDVAADSCWGGAATPSGSPGPSGWTLRSADGAVRRSCRGSSTAPLASGWGRSCSCTVHPLGPGGLAKLGAASSAAYSPHEAVEFRAGFISGANVPSRFSDFQSREPIRCVIFRGACRSPSISIDAHGADPREANDHRRHSGRSARIQPRGRVGMTEVM